MASTAHQLNARRAGMLLHVQRIREDRQRLESLRADQAHLAATEAERAARQALGAHEAETARQLVAAHEAVRGRVIGPDALSTLKDIENGLSLEVTRRMAALRAAEAAIRQTQESADAALAALQAQARATAKRTKLADSTARRWRDLVDAAQEIERDDQIADTWRA